VAELLYKAQTAAGEAPGAAGPSAGDKGAEGDVIDAEYTEEKGGSAN
jgi:hypothetical protein